MTPSSPSPYADVLRDIRALDLNADLRSAWFLPVSYIADDNICHGPARFWVLWIGALNKAEEESSRAALSTP